MNKLINIQHVVLEVRHLEVTSCNWEAIGHSLCHMWTHMTSVVILVEHKFPYFFSIAKAEIGMWEPVMSLAYYIHM